LGSPHNLRQIFLIRIQVIHPQLLEEVLPLLSAKRYDLCRRKQNLAKLKRHNRRINIEQQLTIKLILRTRRHIYSKEFSGRQLLGTLSKTEIVLSSSADIINFGQELIFGRTVSPIKWEFKALIIKKVSSPFTLNTNLKKMLIRSSKGSKEKRL